MRYLDGFSGYGGFHLGLERAGFKFDEVYFSEIDKHAIANYSYNFPNSIYAGSITDVSRRTIPSLDLFTFGWPCQDNSIAGKRKGQREGTRSGLLYEAVRILNEFKPRNFIAENVLGLLSVNEGVDIIESLKLLSYLNESCPQYDIEMQLLNTRWVLPQNRERLFFVGHLRGSGSRQIFPIGDGIGQVLSEGNGKDCAGCISTKNSSGQCQFDGSTTLIKVPSATVSGFELAGEGDSINLSVPESKTRRGRVGKGVAQTLDTSCNQAVVNHKMKIICGTLRPQIGGEGFRLSDEKCSPTLTTKNDETTTGTIIVGNDLYTLRRLTPTECERLQGLPDGHTKYGNYNGQVKELSDTQRYRLCGNGVSVPIIELIGKQLFKA